MPWWPPACAALATLAVTLWKIQAPSFWRDEGATQSATRRSFTDLIAMLGHVDAVHGAYYLLMWLEVRLAGHGELALRLPSALAMAATAALITVTGRRLVSQRAGLAAGLTFAALPAVSWFAQDARPFALETAAGAAASYSWSGWPRTAPAGTGRAATRPAWWPSGWPTCSACCSSRHTPRPSRSGSPRAAGGPWPAGGGARPPSPAWRCCR